MYKIAVLGDYDSIYGFAALGLEIFPVSDESEAGKILKRICGGSYAVVYITEEYAELLKEEIEVFKQRELPAIILIPGISKNTGKGIENVKKTVEQAVGSDILFGEK